MESGAKNVQGNAKSGICGNEEVAKISLKTENRELKATGPRKHWSEEELARVDTSHSF